VPKPIKLLEVIGNGGNGALNRSTVILWTNYQHFMLIYWGVLETMAV